MNETLSKISQQITDYWNGFSKQQRIKIGIISLLVILILSMVIYLTTRPQMVPLFSDLSYKQAADIQESLNELGINNVTAQDGTSIKVEAKDVDKAKLALAREGIPNAGFTYEDALENNMGTTETEKQAKLKYAKEQELSRNIASKIEGIESATVNLVIPDDDHFFLETQRQPRASIQLTTRDKLSQSQILGVARYVAYSVENLELNNINIIDQNANPLYSGTENDDTSRSLDKRYELENMKKKEIETKVVSTLAPMFDDVRVTVNLVMDFDANKQMKESYSTPEDRTKGIPKYENKESSQVVNGTGGEEPGVAANGGDIPQYAMEDQATSEAKSEKTQSEYYVDKTVSETVKSIGDILYDQSSLSVVVYKEKAYDQSDLVEREMINNTDSAWAEFKEQNGQITPITVDQPLISAIQTGTGIDNLDIVGYEKPIFIDAPVEETNWTQYVSLGILLLIIILLAFAIIKGTAPEEISEIEPELSVEDMLASSLKNQEELESIEYSEKSEVKQQIEKFVDEKPEAVAQLLRNWLSDEWE